MAEYTDAARSGEETVRTDSPARSGEETVRTDSPARSGEETVRTDSPARSGEQAARADDSPDSGENRAKTAFGGDTPAPRRNVFVRFLLCVFSFLLVSGIVLLTFYMLKLEPFGTKAVTIDDAKIQYIDFFTYYVDVLRGIRPLTYDFSNTLGRDSIGIFGYYLASPFNLLLYYFGKEGVYRFFDVAVLLKLGTAAATFAWYLQRRFADRIRPVFVVALSMGYGLMQYTVQQSSNIMWLDGVYMLPLIMLGVYEVLHKKSVWRLAVSVALCICFNWYIAGVSCLFSGIWFFFEFFFQDSTVQERMAFSKEARRRSVPRGERPAGSLVVGFTDFFLSFCRYVWGMGLGIGLSALLFMPVISAMRQGTGQYDEIKFVVKMSGDMLSAVRGYVIGTVSDRGFAALFCGGIAVSAAAALLFSRGFRIRQKIAFLAMAGVCFLMLHWEPAMLAFSLLKKADSYWYRYGYLLCFALLFFAGAWLSRAEQDRWSKAAMAAAAVLFAAAVLKLNGVHARDLRAQGAALVRANVPVFATAASCVALALLTVLILSGRRASGKPAGAGLSFARGLAAVLLLVITGAELLGNAWLFWGSNTDNSQELYMQYSEGMQTQLAQIRAQDDGYYRISQDRTRWHYEDDLTAYFNDALAQNYWSTTSYTSSQDDTQLSLMWRLGYRDEGGRMLIVRDPMIAADSFLGVKYLLLSEPVEGLEPVEGVDPFNGRTVYRNPFALPMAFVYDGEKLPTMRYDSTFVYQNELYSTLSGKKTQLYTPLTWTKYNEGNKSYFSVYIPQKKDGSRYETLAYGNLLWYTKKGGLMSVNGAEPAGYCRWMSPAAFLLRSRAEQSQSGAGESLQAVRRAQQEAEKEAEAKRAEMERAESAEDGAEEDAAADQPGAEAAGDSAADQSGEAAVTESELSLQKKELAEAAAAYDREALSKLDQSGYEDVRTVVFQTSEDLSFKDSQFYGLDLEVLEDVTERIRSGEVTDLTIENGHVRCSLDGVSGRSLCLLVPWSKGWSVTRNGEPVQPDTVAGAMITVPLENGKNEIEMYYEVPYLREGMYVSLAAAAVLLVDMIVRFALGRRDRSR